VLSESEERLIVCTPYTRARRYPSVIGKVGGYSGWPLPATFTQVGLALLSIFTLVKTKPLWAHFGPGNLIIFAGVPLSVFYCARRVRVEGRAPWAAALGFLQEIGTGPRLQGAAWRKRTVTRVRSTRMMALPEVHWHRHIVVALHRHESGGDARSGPTVLVHCHRGDGDHLRRGVFSGLHLHLHLWHRHVHERTWHRHGGRA
jgi:hypothetical protein